MINFLIRILEKLDRKNQLSILENHPKVTVAGTMKLGTGNHFVLYPELKRVDIGKDFNIRNGLNFIVRNGAVLEIGDRVFMNNFCSVNCLHSVSIGENTLFGENVKIYDHNHHYERTDGRLNLSHSEFTKAPVKIGKNCWLGSNVTVLKGVTIGDNCIIGAGCTIAKDIPENSTVINQQELIFK